MKKLRKLLSGFMAAAMIASMGAVNVSVCAQNSFDILDVDKDELKLVISKETSRGRSELWIDDTYRYIMAELFKTTVAIRMTDGTEPPSVEDSNSSIVQKLTDIQKVNLMSVESVWFMDIDDIQLSDDLYVVNGFISTDDAEAYCQALIDDGKADYAEPVLTGRYSYCHPHGTLMQHFEVIGKEFDESKIEEINAFSANAFIFALAGKDETATIDYLKENIEGFEECVSVTTHIDSTVWFQFKDDAVKETTVNVLAQMCELENFNKPFIPVYAQLTNSLNAKVNSMPEKYKNGDVDMNEKIDLYDAIEVAKKIMNTRTFSDVETVLADMNKDDVVNLYDAIEIAKSLM